MILAIIREKDYNGGFYIDGHADFADAGGDIVCAAVSILADTTALSFEGETEILDADGILTVSFKDYMARDDAIRLDLLKTGLLAIEEQFPTNLKVLIDDGGYINE